MTMRLYRLWPSGGQADSRIEMEECMQAEPLENVHRRSGWVVGGERRKCVFRASESAFHNLFVRFQNHARRAYGVERCYVCYMEIFLRYVSVVVGWILPSSEKHKTDT